MLVLFFKYTDGLADNFSANLTAFLYGFETIFISL